MIQGWSLIHALSPSTTANSFGLTNNCYYCTAAALQGMTCIGLTAASSVPQKHNGGIDDFRSIVRGDVQRREFGDIKVLEQFLLAELRPMEAVALGYSRHSGTGHMIVAFKVANRLDVQPVLNGGQPQGHQVNTVQPPQGHLRHIDYQLTCPKTIDGLIPLNDAQSISRYIVFWRA